jgi:hypothetical protein
MVKMMVTLLKRALQIHNGHMLSVASHLQLPQCVSQPLTPISIAASSSVTISGLQVIDFTQKRLSHWSYNA